MPLHNDFSQIERLARFGERVLKLVKVGGLLGRRPRTAAKRVSKPRPAPKPVASPPKPPVKKPRPHTASREAGLARELSTPEE